MDPIKIHTFIVNPLDNSGEHLSIKTEFRPSGDPTTVEINHFITLRSYFNSASFTLLGAQLTPEILRQLANELEVAYEEAIQQLQ